MRYLKKLSVGILTLVLAVGASMLSQAYINTYAANTLTGNNEVITVSDTTDSQPVNATISPLGYSGDGNVILFASQATNLPGAGGPATGLYIYNIKTSTTSRVDISTGGTLPNASWFVGAGAPGAYISETGRYITFASYATNLIDGETKPGKYIYKRDTQTETTTVVGVGYTGGYSDKWDRNIAVSNDGRFSLVSSRYLANGYPNNYGYALGDNSSGSYTWTSLGVDSYYEDAGVGGMSCDGAFVVFRKAYNIYLTDLRNGSTTTVAAGDYDNVSPTISCNGRYVLYATKNRTQITPTPTGMDTYYHLARYDRITGERAYIDSNSSGTFSGAQLSYNSTYNNPQPNIFNASIADTGDVVFDYKSGVNTYSYLKHLSDGSGTLEPIAKKSDGSYVNMAGGTITSDGRYIFFKADPYDLGIGSSPAGTQIIRAKTNL